MIIVVKPNTKEEEIQRLIKMIETQGLKIHFSRGVDHTILGIVGDTTLVDVEKIRSSRIVKDVLRVQEPYKKANRLFHPEDTIIDVKGRKVGEGTVSVFAGPCSVESEDQVVSIAKSIKESGATFLRGGAFK